MKRAVALAIVWITIGFLLLRASPATCQLSGAEDIPIYSGWSEIKPSHHTFILLGDTQSTSHWEFWRERNNKERKQMIDEITRREPAFVLHLGDLTTRGGFKKALAGVRPAAQRISSEEDPLYSYPGKS